MMMENEWLTPKDVCDILPFGIQTVRKMFKMDGFPAVRIGRKFAVKRKDLEEWLEINKGKELSLP